MPHPPSRTSNNISLIILAFLLLGFNPIEASAAASKHLLYTSIESNNAQPSSDQKQYFDCSDKIYAVLELTNFTKGRHALSLRWFDPAQEEREKVDYPFTVTQKETRLWGWLNLIRPKGAGMIQWINPAAGLEEFIGPWTIEAYINNKKIASNTFSVDC